MGTVIMYSQRFGKKVEDLVIGVYRDRTTLSECLTERGRFGTPTGPTNLPHWTHY